MIRSPRTGQAARGAPGRGARPLPAPRASEIYRLAPARREPLPPDIRPLTLTPQTLDQLAATLVEVVAGGGSVGFMHPLSIDDARAFWTRSLDAAGAGARIVLGAMAGGEVVATVTLLLDCPPNQPHRAEIAKMMTRPAHRGRGLASALLAEAERLAVLRGRTLLTLDTAEEDGASALYERHGYRFAGLIPDYALKPHGGLTGTRLYFKRIGAATGAAGEGGGASQGSR
jgi:ribosomal protein S18 acetylase RimI-like enzyme